MMGPGMMGGFGAMGLGMVVFWGLIIWLVVALAQGSTGTRSYDSSHADSALEVLKKRYARGEISKEEYEERKKDLV
ncbi:MAG: SHOCT domain-containing protein [Chloroflexota bacterium]|nr:SHOCT domain-containing protein [Chloroflexota bacterium]